jgi:hypothetical protein
VALHRRARSARGSHQSVTVLASQPSREPRRPASLAKKSERSDPRRGGRGAHGTPKPAGEDARRPSPDWRHAERIANRPLSQHAAADQVSSHGRARSRNGDRLCPLLRRSLRSRRSEESGARAAVFAQHLLETRHRGENFASRGLLTDLLKFLGLDKTLRYKKQRSKSCLNARFKNRLSSAPAPCFCGL